MLRTRALCENDEPRRREGSDVSAMIDKSAADEGRISRTVEQLLAEYSGADVCDAELQGDRRDPSAVAFTVVSENGDALRTTPLSYGERREESEVVAAVLSNLGAGSGDSVATLMGKSAELVAVILGIWRLGAVYVPLFTAFAWPAIEMRLGARERR